MKNISKVIAIGIVAIFVLSAFAGLFGNSFIKLINLAMIYKIIRQDKESDEITQQSFNSYDEAYDLLEEIYSDVCCSDADYGDRPYYEIIEIKE